MTRLAVIEVEPDGSRLRCSLTHAARLSGALRQLGGASGDGRGEWVLPYGQLEPVQCLFDRRGYRWALRADDDLPRTWAERLLAEVPTDHHGAIVDACAQALADCPDHLALLDLAYRSARERSGGGVIHRRSAEPPSADPEGAARSRAVTFRRAASGAS